VLLVVSRRGTCRDTRPCGRRPRGGGRNNQAPHPRLTQLQQSLSHQSAICGRPTLWAGNWSAEAMRAPESGSPACTVHMYWLVTRRVAPRRPAPHRPRHAAICDAIDTPRLAARRACGAWRTVKGPLPVPSTCPPRPAHTRPTVSVAAVTYRHTAHAWHPPGRWDGHVPFGGAAWPVGCGWGAAVPPRSGLWGSGAP